MRFNFLFGVASVVFLTGLAQAQASQPSEVAPPPVITPVAPPAPPAPPAKPQLKGTSVYVYSFLDIRKAEFGEQVLAQFHRQMLDALRKEGVSPQLQLFGDSFVGSLWVPSTKVFNGQRVQENAPVLETIAANLERERAAGSRYRLLILPAEFELIGAWRHYTVRWMIMDTATDQIGWRRDYKGKHLTMWRTNENAEGRGRKLTEGGLTLMREDRII